MLNQRRRRWPSIVATSLVAGVTMIRTVYHYHRVPPSRSLPCYPLYLHHPQCSVGVLVHYKRIRVTPAAPDCYPSIKPIVRVFNPSNSIKLYLCFRMVGGK